MPWKFYSCGRFTKRALVRGDVTAASSRLRHFLVSQNKHPCRLPQFRPFRHSLPSGLHVLDCVPSCQYFCVRLDFISNQYDDCKPLLGSRLKTFLNQQTVPAIDDGSNFEDAIAFWKHAENILRDSLKEIRVLRARVERNGEDKNNLKLMLTVIKDCIQLLDRLSNSLPRAEEFSTTWLFTPRKVDSEKATEIMQFTSVLDDTLLNELLKEWMTGWKLQQQQVRGETNRSHQQRLLPSPAKMAERVDKYRSTSLAQPNPRSFNLLLNGMILGSTDQRSAVKLADDYLQRLINAQDDSSLSSSPRKPKYVDAYSLATVMKGWINLRKPEKAQQWLDRAIESPVLNPNAVVYSTAIHGWAKAGNPLKAESILYEAVQKAVEQMEESIHMDGMDEIMAVDRIAFHTVLDAWAARAATKHHNGGRNHRDEIIPAVRAKALVHSMENLANRYPRSFEHLRPNEESWYKLISTIALQQPPSTIEPEEFGPRAAEALLTQFESDQEISTTTIPAILLNRILQAYCASGTQMEDAEDFYHRRCRKAEGLSSDSNIGPTFPNEVTFHTILSGWARAAEVTNKREHFQSKKKKNKRSTSNFRAEDSVAGAGIPFRAESWLEKMHRNQHIHTPSTRAYASVLQAWSLSTQYHTDAANRAEELLKRQIWTMEDTVDAHGITVCTNIVLRAWSNQVSSHSKDCDSRQNRAVGRCIRLMNNFLALLKENPHFRLVKPTAETFRAVLYAIVSPSNGMDPVQKHDHLKAILTLMEDVFHIPPRPEDIKKFERIRSLKERYLERIERSKHRHR